MSALARWAARRMSQRLATRYESRRWALLLPLAPVATIVFLVLFVCLLVGVELVNQNGGGCGTTVPISAPGANVQTTVAVGRYLESQGIAANGAAGVEGNIQWESGDLNPEAPGGGLAQWLGKRWTDMVTTTTAWGYPGDSPDPKVAMAGQLMYIVYDLRTSYATLLAELNSAPDPATAATMFETVYEVCSGVTGYMQVTSGSLCNDPTRRQYAITVLLASGGSSTVNASLVTGGACVAVGGSGGDPIPGFIPGRDDMGVDACAKPGMPIVAPAQSTLVDVVPGWYGPQPLLLFQFNPPIAGTYGGDEYWYVAEQIVPASTTRGTVFGPGQPVATYASSGTCVEVGWGSPSTNSRTLVPTDANPPRGGLTPEAESFKVFFHIPWVGSSP